MKAEMLNLLGNKYSISVQRFSDKINVKFSPCLTKHHAMKAYWGVEVYLHAFFDLGTRWR